MKPTVSVSRYGRPWTSSARVVGSSVWKSRSCTAGVGAGERVEQARLAGVRVAGERDRRELRALALAPHRPAGGARALEPPLERRDPVARQAAVGLDLGLPRSARPDPAAEALEVRPQAAHAGEVVLELGELDLELALGRVRVVGEDVEDDRRAVDHRHAGLLLEVALLAREQLVVAGDQVGVRLRERAPSARRACPCRGSGRDRARAGAGPARPRRPRRRSAAAP